MDLIERLRKAANLCEPSAKPLRSLLTESAAALEAAREDACRLDWLADRDNPIGNVQLPSVCADALLAQLARRIGGGA